MMKNQPGPTLFYHINLRNICIEVATDAPEFVTNVPFQTTTAEPEVLRIFVSLIHNSGCFL